MSLEYTKWAGLPISTMPRPRNLFNVNSTLNKLGSLKHYTDLTVQTRMHCVQMRFFLSNLGVNKIILGYPWFAAFHPKVDWARGWIDVTNLPIVTRTDDAAQIWFLLRRDTPCHRYYNGPDSPRVKTSRSTKVTMRKASIYPYVFREWSDKSNQGRQSMPDFDL
jgi:hypothetical protein